MEVVLQLSNKLLPHIDQHCVWNRENEAHAEWSTLPNILKLGGGSSVQQETFITHVHQQFVWSSGHEAHAPRSTLLTLKHFLREVNNVLL